jgi:hypothetical protein
MPARNKNEFVSQTESLAEVNWSVKNKAITEKAKGQGLGLQFLVRQESLIRQMQL